jgi:hypothetical protein
VGFNLRLPRIPGNPGSKGIERNGFTGFEALHKGLGMSLSFDFVIFGEFEEKSKLLLVRKYDKLI